MCAVGVTGMEMAEFCQKHLLAEVGGKLSFNLKNENKPVVSLEP